MTDGALTLAGLFERCPHGVLVPILQRDFAQGRPEVRAVRTRFLDALHAALCRPPGARLDLDFVYGHVEGDRFVPIDGQQRLTTLFLLHWYLAVREGEGEHFLGWAQRGGRPRFSYEVRPSSEDFFAGLIAATRPTAAGADALRLIPRSASDHALSKTLRDQTWYFRSWRLDPSVRASLLMLDAIHARFHDAPTGLYRRLTDTHQPAITFQFLDLDEAGLGDDLYLKMNARGCRLTAFETFKSELEGWVRNHPDLAGERAGRDAVPLHDYLGTQLDTRWLQLIWGLLRQEHGDGAGDWTRHLDPQYLNLIRAVAVAGYDIDGAAAERADPQLDALHNGVVVEFGAWEAAGAITPRFVRTVIGLLDRLVDEAGQPRTWLARREYYDEWVTVRRIREDRPRPPDARTKPQGTVTYEEMARFSAWCEAVLGGNEPPSDLHDWMRVICNLTRATAIDRGERLRRALVATRRLRAAGPILDHLVRGGDVEFFLGQQVREERIKAGLLLRDAAWRPLLEQAETHPYFQGQIEFALAASGVLERWLRGSVCDWSDLDDAAFQSAFRKTWERVLALFPADGKGELRRPGDFLLERALLSRGNYLLSKGRNCSLLNDQDPEVSWRRLLRADAGEAWRTAKRAIFLDVLAQVDPGDVDGSLRRVIAEGVKDNGDDSVPWRRILVRRPEMMAYCRERWLRFAEGGQVLLLPGVNRATHRGLYTWNLGLELLNMMAESAFSPFNTFEAPDVYGYSVPPHLQIGEQAHPEHSLAVTCWEGAFWVVPLAKLAMDDDPAWVSTGTLVPEEFAVWLRGHAAARAASSPDEGA
jgi:hypothetical protein